MMVVEQQGVTVISTNNADDRHLNRVADKLRETGVSKHVVAIKKLTRLNTATVLWRDEPTSTMLNVFHSAVNQVSNYQFNHVLVEGEI